jgi:hypothetical protein
VNKQASWKEKIEKTPEFESQWRARLYDFVVSPPFQFFIAACIAMNVCVLASFHEGQTQGWTTFQNVCPNPSRLPYPAGRTSFCSQYLGSRPWRCRGQDAELTAERRARTGARRVS